MTTAAIETFPKLRRLGDDTGDYSLRPAIRAVMDPTMLAAAYGEHCRSAYSVAYRILGDGPAAEDAVQDAFLKLWTGTAQFDPSRGSMRGLLMTIARHTSIDVIRKQSRRQQTESRYCADATYVTDGPEHATERADDARRVRDAVEALPGEQRSAIEMAYFAGLTCRQIAVEMTIPIGTVKSRMRLGMGKLAVTLGNGALRTTPDYPSRSAGGTVTAGMKTPCGVPSGFTLHRGRSSVSGRRRTVGPALQLVAQ
ncbi:MAG: sigma-70 family RNA polymerase sigma factor [Chloroflexota bacterium]|nr:sigma-70 family RNA polymerase sigma factor [Chloroflexota bacterium]